LGESLRIGVASLQVPTFVGEGASLALELTGPMDGDAVEARLNAMDGVLVTRDGFGSRGLAAIEEDSAEPVGPTMRDAIGSDEILVGRIEADGSLPAGEGWRLWMAFDPLRLVADQALRLAGRRLGLA
jgi:aspartate-semialdehyde dehydrogenase